VPHRRRMPHRRRHTRRGSPPCWDGDDCRDAGHFAGAQGLSRHMGREEEGARRTGKGARRDTSHCLQAAAAQHRAQSKNARSSDSRTPEHAAAPRSTPHICYFDTSSDLSPDVATNDMLVALRWLPAVRFRLRALTVNLACGLPAGALNVPMAKKSSSKPCRDLVGCARDHRFQFGG
jgi:hypothetical protein